MRNLRVTIQYDGTNYCGWQKQPGSLGIQGTIENAIYEITKEKVKLVGSGRTDAGVHALGQVANFELNHSISTDKVSKALNAKLPIDIAIVDCIEVYEGFHSRYHAKAKTYRYIIYNSLYRNPIYGKNSYHVKYDLDFEKLKMEAKSLEGTHDFRSFMGSGSSIKNTVRTVFFIDVKQDDEFITIEIKGSGFLYNMVRIIAGTLVDIGRGRITIPLLEIINSKDRGKAGHTAPAHGLFLKKVDY